MPIIILLVIPVASTGGIAALSILNQFIKQPLDMLTMLGFVILTGIVVNNAILLVEQTVLQVREEVWMLKVLLLKQLETEFGQFLCQL